MSKSWSLQGAITTDMNIILEYELLVMFRIVNSLREKMASASLPGTYIINLPKNVCNYNVM